MNKTVVIGGGLAGLSAAYHLRDSEAVVFEHEERIGGLCRSFAQDGFTFDVTGHLIHLKNPYTRELIEELLPGVLVAHERRAAIYSKSVTTPYPFQANTFGLPVEVVKECVLGFVGSLHEDPKEAQNFYDWIFKTFGDGIAQHFMVPFNEKFWKRDLREMTADWVSWSIPKPTLEEVINGALGLTNNGLGYNPLFTYPARGGIECLPNALAGSLEGIQTGHTLARVDSRNKVAHFTNGREESYDQLVTTIPLPVFYQLLEDAPEDLLARARKLRAISVMNINIGVDRERISNQHWIYFPEDKFVFSRVGFPANFSSSAAPPGTSSIYIEITHNPDQPVNAELLYERSLHDLEVAGILCPGDSITTRFDIRIPHAYVVFDRNRKGCLDDLIQYLATRDIHTAGRYGQWDYFSMEDSILSGKMVAETIAPTHEITATAHR